MLADEVLQQGVRSITDLMVMPGLINLDFADVRSVMSEMGKAMMGTGEGEGDNRALEAAERAIANPLLDGVSMQGAKGVIISIIGGEDMKLLEVDEAANHIRELVDEDANIIWGSAFNPDLDGKIRVSVVATGIEGGGEAAAAAPRSFSMSQSRAPQRPVLDLPNDDVAEEEPFELNAGLAAEPATDKGGDDFDDVDDIVDPLAGMRNEQTERFDAHGGVPSPASDAGFGATGSGDQGWTDEEDGAARPPLDLSEPVAEENASGQDELQLGSDQVADGQSPLASKPARAGGVPENGGAAAGGIAGSTLFERMANLSRGAAPGGSPSSAEYDEDDDDDDNSGGGLNIPRFLGRQNNQ